MNGGQEAEWREKEESVTLVTISMCFEGRRGEKREKGKSQSHQSQILMCFESRKERKWQEPVISVMILMQPMAVAHMKLDNHAGSKGHPLLIHRTSFAGDATLASPNPNTHLWLRLILIATFALLSVGG